MRSPSELQESGSLDGSALPRILVALYRERYSGGLGLRRDRGEKEILFRQGAPVQCTSSLASESLASRLVEAGTLTRLQQARVTQLAQEKGCQEGAALLALKLIDPGELFQAMRQHLRRGVIECFGWTGGHFALDRSAVPSDDTEPFRTDPYGLIQEGLVAHWSIERLLGELTPLLGLYPERGRGFAELARRLGGLGGLGRPGSDPAVGELCAAIDGVHRFDQALGTGANSPALLAAAWLLDAAGALRYRNEPVSSGQAASEIEIQLTGAAPTETAATPGRPSAQRAAGAGPGRANPQAEKMREEVLERHASLNELNYYEILGVSQDADAAALKKAYFQSAKRYHPDALGRLDLGDVRAEAVDVFARIARAYETLSNPDRRVDYDAALAYGGEAYDADALAQAETSYRKGEIMVKMGDFRGALEYLERAVELWPQECAYQSLLGWAYYKKIPCETGPALEHLRKAVEIDASDAIAHFRLGVVLRESGDTDGASEHLARARQIDPGAAG